jgi:hypothetical protein
MELSLALPKLDQLDGRAPDVEADNTLLGTGEEHVLNSPKPNV